MNNGQPEINPLWRAVARRSWDRQLQIADVRKDMQLVRKDLQLEMAGIRSEQKLILWMLSAGVLGILSLVVKAFLVTAL